MEQDSRQELARAVAPALAEAVRTGRCLPVGCQAPPRPTSWEAVTGPAPIAPALLAPARAIAERYACHTPNRLN